MAGVKLEVEGLKELRRELKRLDATMPKELQRINKSVAELLVEPAKARAESVRTSVKGNPTRLGSAGVATIRALAGQSRAQIAMGSARVGYVFGHEWGSKGAYPQFPPKSREGYILYPTIREHRQEIMDAYGDALDALTSAAFPD